MMSGAAIRAMNDNRAERAEEQGIQPLEIPIYAWDPETIRNLPYFDDDGNEIGQGIPHLGYYEPDGWETVLEDALMVDTSGWGRPGEPALTLSEFMAEGKRLTREHGTLGWALIETGQFQGYVQAFKRSE